MSTLENTEDPDEMQHDAAFHQGLHCLPRLNNLKRQINHILEDSACDPLKCTMGSLNVHGKSIRI